MAAKPFPEADWVIAARQQRNGAVAEAQEAAQKAWDAQHALDGMAWLALPALGLFYALWVLVEAARRG